MRARRGRARARRARRERELDELLPRRAGGGRRRGGDRGDRGRAPLVPLVRPRRGRARSARSSQRGVAPPATWPHVAEARGRRERRDGGRALRREPQPLRAAPRREDVLAAARGRDREAAESAAARRIRRGARAAVRAARAARAPAAARLRPGDLLHVPPYWLHSVVSDPPDPADDRAADRAAADRARPPGLDNVRGHARPRTSKPSRATRARPLAAWDGAGWRGADKVAARSIFALSRGRS